MNATPPSLVAPRRPTRQIHVGRVAIGGGAPISVQSMTKTDTRDPAATLAQIRLLARAGCDLIRLAVPDAEAARALAAICRASPLPVVADIHFDHRLALEALAAGVDGLRINPGNIGDPSRVAAIAKAARERRVPIRIGINAGSLDRETLARYGGATAEALAASARRHLRLLEDLDFRDIKLSVKASDAARTVKAYRLLAASCDYPLHLGVTEAGTLLSGAVHSTAAMTLLLAGGIGDTLRVSLTEHPLREIKAGLEILRALGLRRTGPRVVSCPTCGRVQIDVVGLAHRVETALDRLAGAYPCAAWPSVAVMGCVVNGPGEAREADLAIAGGKGKSALYVGGRLAATLRESEIVPALVREVRRFLARPPPAGG